MTDLHGISQDADNLIINEETGGQPYYEKTEMHPDWPGGMSGVTVGNGYDCGYSDPATIAADWGPVLPADEVAALQSVAGIHGSPAQSHARELHWITIPWDAAMAVYHNRDLPKWVGIVQSALPNCDQLNGDQLGALTSLAFNRGPSFDQPGDRYVEMRNIKAHMEAERFDLIPAEFLSMRRLWPQGGDLWNRRGHESALFENGLHEQEAPAQVLQPTLLTVANPPPICDPKWVQTSLNALGYGPLTVDGNFGKISARALRAFQADHGIAVDGIAGGETDDAITTALAAIVGGA